MAAKNRISESMSDIKIPAANLFFDYDELQKSIPSRFK